jgi:type IV secretion system protein VirD4
MIPTLPLGILLGRPMDSQSASAHGVDPLDAPKLPKKYSLNGLGREISLSSLRHYRGKEDIGYNGEGHLITIAPTGSGKGVSAIIPNLLTFPGPVVVIDPKGENYAVTARRRRELGHRVIRLDPFRLMDSTSDALNPLDLFSLGEDFDDTDAEMLAELLSVGNKGLDDPFWDNSGQGLLAGTINVVASPHSTYAKNLISVRNLLSSDDVVYNLSVVLDTIGKKIPPMAYREISSFLQLPEITRGGVLSVAKSYFKSLMSEKVATTVEASTFPLAEFVAGMKLSIYLIIPPHKLVSHRALLRLWIGTLMNAVTNRRHKPELRTLFVLDECGQLGHMAHLETLVTLCRGYGVNAWMFWQDLSQLRSLYGEVWQTMLNNCEVVQMFGAKNHTVAREFAEITGTSAKKVRDLLASEQILMRGGRKPLRAQRFDYRFDERFKGMYDMNPLHAASKIPKPIPLLPTPEIEE